MKAIAIPNHEKEFQTTGIDAQGKAFVLKENQFAIGTTTEKVTITNCPRKDGFKGYYYEEVSTKKKIVLHFTMGYLKGDIATLTKGYVSVPFVIGRNGSIYNLFASKYWSYHLGPAASGGNKAMSKECVGIEISNIGPLKKIGNNLVTLYKDTDVYCSLDDTQHYTKTTFRGYEYYATYTDQQYEALIKLIRFLCFRYAIPRTFLAEAKRFTTLNAMEFKAFTGIASHVNCRKDKADIGPAFDWKRVMDGVML